jgi:tRNA dimethylallyltransferase
MEGVNFEAEIVMPARDVLYQRCNKRFELMTQNGVLDEVAALDARIKSGEIATDAAITRTLGFKELQDYLRGVTSLEDAITLAQIQTRQYAKRQTTFFRNQALC